MARRFTPRRPGARRGQGMTEYIIIVVLVALGALFSVILFGDSVNVKFLLTNERVDSDLDVSGETP